MTGSYFNVCQILLGLFMETTECFTDVLRLITNNYYKDSYALGSQLLRTFLKRDGIRCTS